MNARYTERPLSAVFMTFWGHAKVNLRYTNIMKMNLIIEVTFKSLKINYCPSNLNKSENLQSLKSYENSNHSC